MVKRIIENVGNRLRALIIDSEGREQSPVFEKVLYLTQEGLVSRDTLIGSAAASVRKP